MRTIADSRRVIDVRCASEDDARVLMDWIAHETPIGASRGGAVVRMSLPTRSADQPPTVADERDPECVERWPDCYEGGYDPACCRFPKSCSCTVDHAAPTVTDEMKEAAVQAWEAHRFRVNHQEGGALSPLPHGSLDIVLEAAARARQEKRDG